MWSQFGLRSPLFQLALKTQLPKSYNLGILRDFNQLLNHFGTVTLLLCSVCFASLSSLSYLCPDRKDKNFHLFRLTSLSCAVELKSVSLLSLGICGTWTGQPSSSVSGLLQASMGGAAVPLSEVFYNPEIKLRSYIEQVFAIWSRRSERGKDPPRNKRPGSRLCTSELMVVDWQCASPIKEDIHLLEAETTLDSRLHCKVPRGDPISPDPVFKKNSGKSGPSGIPEDPTRTFQAVQSSETSGLGLDMALPLTVMPAHLRD